MPTKRPDDRSRHCLTLVARVQPDGEYSPPVRTSWGCSACPPPIRAVGRRTIGCLRERTWNLAPPGSLLWVIGEGAGS
jgi:hypothetical protein